VLVAFGIPMNGYTTYYVTYSSIVGSIFAFYTGTSPKGKNND